MAICRDCGKDKVTGYQEIHTRRKTIVIICNECLKKYQRKEVANARDN